MWTQLPWASQVRTLLCCLKRALNQRKCARQVSNIHAIWLIMTIYWVFSFNCLLFPLAFISSNIVVVACLTVFHKLCRPPDLEGAVSEHAERPYARPGPQRGRAAGGTVFDHT